MANAAVIVRAHARTALRFRSVGGVMGFVLTANVQQRIANNAPVCVRGAANGCSKRLNILEA